MIDVMRDIRIALTACAGVFWAGYLMWLILAHLADLALTID